MDADARKKSRHGVVGWRRESAFERGRVVLLERLVRVIARHLSSTFRVISVYALGEEPEGPRATE